MAYPWSWGTAGIARRSVERTKKFPWKEAILSPTNSTMRDRIYLDKREEPYLAKHAHA